MTVSRRPGALQLVGWMVALAVVVLGMLALGGTPALAGPPLTHPEDLASWLTARPPVESAFAVLRLVVLVLAAYLLAVTVLGVALRLVRAGRLVRAVDLVTLPAVRKVVGSAFGVGLMGAPLAVVGPTAPAGVAQVQLVVGAAAPSQPGADLPPGSPEASPPTMRRLDEPPSPAATATDVVVGAGDHLWSVADRALTGAWGRAASDAELAPYWEQVVAVNRERLADPGNPDLLFPGQVVSVPTPPAAPPA
jgi:hypothetical protein